MSNAQIYSANGTMVFIADIFLENGKLFGTKKLVVEADGNKKVYWKRRDTAEFKYHNKKGADEIIALAKEQLK